MSEHGSEERRIGELRQRIEAQRSAIGQQARTLAPGVEVLAKTGSALRVVRQVLPFVRPIAGPLLLRLFSSKRKRKLLLLLGVGAAAFGGWRFLSSDPEDPEA